MLRKKLRNHAKRTIFENRNRAFRNRPATLLGTVHDAGEIAHTDDFQVVVLADAETATQLADDTKSKPLWRLRDLAIFALVSENKRLDTTQHFELEARLGPTIFDSFVKPILPNVTVCHVGPSNYPPARRRDPVERKRDNIWNNGARNGTIAGIASACRDDNQALLRAHGIRLPEAKEASDDDAMKPHDFHSSPRSVAVIVESLQHARLLQKLLPWTIFDGQNTGNTYEPHSPLQPTKAIITWMRACRDGLAVDVLIRADGTAAKHQNWFGPHVWINRRPMAIIDFHDDFDETAKSATLGRKQDYESRGFVVPIS
jgi:hypothetical protein